jgi:serine phosphatase RsbU (regulator of sigma subunit)/PAS domain-containing protein
LSSKKGRTSGDTDEARTRRVLEEPPGFLDAAAGLATARNADELARRLHGVLTFSGATASLLAVIEPDGALRLTGTAGRPADTVSEWSRVSLLHSLPLARLSPDDQLHWLTDEVTGEELLTWVSTGANGPRARPDEVAGRVVSVVSVVWADGTSPVSDQTRDHLNGLASCAGRRLRTLAGLGLPADDLRSPWLDAVLGAIPIPAALLFPIRDWRGHVVEFSIDRCNAHATDLLGRTPEEITGRRLLEAFPGLETAGVFEGYVQVLETGAPLDRGPFKYEEPVRGVLYPALLSVRAQRVGDGLLVSWQFHDEEARLAARLDDADRLVSLGWAEWNLVTEEISWSGRTYEIFGRDLAEGPLPLGEVPAHVLAEDAPTVAEALRELSERQEPRTFEFRVAARVPGRGPRTVSVTGEPMKDGLGRLIAVRCVVQDVTERRRIETDLAESRLEVERQRRRMTEELQRALLPEAQCDLPGLKVAVRYLPAEDSAYVGGDWYEAAPLPDGRVLLAIGDASGHGLAAAARMAQLRNALLGIAHTGTDAATVLHCLNLVALHSQEAAAIGTAIVAFFDPDDRTLVWARAGHPLPILVRAGRAYELVNGDGTVLGVTCDPGYRSVTVRLKPGDRIMLYTDGLIERRADGNADRLLRDTVAHCVGDGPEGDVEAVMKTLGTVNLEDDTCLVVLHVSGEDLHEEG